MTGLAGRPWAGLTSLAVAIMALSAATTVVMSSGIAPRHGVVIDRWSWGGDDDRTLVLVVRSQEGDQLHDELLYVTEATWTSCELNDTWIVDTATCVDPMVQVTGR